jgi:hypothetical protein
MLRFGHFHIDLSFRPMITEVLFKSHCRQTKSVETQIKDCLTTSSPQAIKVCNSLLPTRSCYRRCHYMLGLQCQLTHPLPELSFPIHARVVSTESCFSHATSSDRCSAFSNCTGSWRGLCTVAQTKFSFSTKSHHEMQVDLTSRFIRQSSIWRG